MKKKKELLGLILVELISAGIMLTSGAGFLLLKADGDAFINVLSVFWLKVVFVLLFFSFLALMIYLPKIWFKNK